jgi:hypothetical protein
MKTENTNAPNNIKADNLSIEQQTMLQQLQSIENSIARQTIDKVENAVENIFQVSKQMIPLMKNDVINNSTPAVTQRFLSLAERPKAKIKGYL